MAVAKKELLARAADGAGLARLLLYLRVRGALPTRHVTVVSYHRITPGGGAAFEGRDQHVTPDLLDQQVGLLKRFFSLLDVSQLDTHLRGAALPRNPAVITFDDGYRDNHDQALPILRRHQVPATFFVSTRYITERRMFWWDHLAWVLGNAASARVVLRYPEPIELDLTGESGRAAAVAVVLRVAKSWPRLDLDRFLAELAEICGVAPDPDEERRLGEALVMGWDHVRALREAGMDVQSHGRSHRVLTTLDDEEAEADLATARREIEERLDSPVVAVAYPTGAAPSHDVVRRAGYRLGFTSGTGVTRLNRPVDLLSLPRLTVTRAHAPGLFRGVLAIPALAYRSVRPGASGPLPDRPSAGG